MKRGVNLCGIEGSPHVTTVSTGDVPPGIPFKFQWNTTTDGLVKYSNCSYTGEKYFTITGSAAFCGYICAATPTCASFVWWSDWCDMFTQSAKKVISLAADIDSHKCGDVISRPNFNFTSGSNGIAMYGKNCEYSRNINSIRLPNQSGDEADCGAICSVIANCTHFLFDRAYPGICVLFGKADKSLPFGPTAVPSSYYPTCGYVTANNTNPPFKPNWKSGANGQVMSAPNCGYIGTEYPADLEIQRINMTQLSEVDCASLCAATKTCSYFRWTNNWCYPMSLVKPAVYYSVTGSCGYVVKRDFVIQNWQNSTNGQVMSSKCAYINVGIKQKKDVWMGNEEDCGNLCAVTLSCNQFNFKGGWCSLMTIDQPVAYPTTSATCGYVVKRPNFNFTSGSNGIAMYGKNCDFTRNINSLRYHYLFYDDEDDCGAICAAYIDCAYFSFDPNFGGICVLYYGFFYRKADKSLASGPSPISSSNYSSCGYVTANNSSSPFKPNWQSVANGQVMFASNCGFIGTAPTDYGVQLINSTRLNEADCASFCAANKDCTHFRWANNLCHPISLLEPAVYYSLTGSCGYVSNRNTTIIWKTGEGLDEMTSPIESLLLNKLK